MKKGILCIAATAFLFSTAEIASKLVAGELDPVQLVFLRFLIGGVFLLPFALRDIRKKKLRFAANDWLFFALTGLLGVAVSMSAFQLAVVYAKASVVAVVFSTNTVFTALFAVLILKERFRPGAAVAIALGLAGVMCIMNPFSLSPDAAGIALSLAAAVVFALYGVIGTKRVGKYGGYVLNSFSFLMGVAMMLPVMLLAGTPVFAGLTWGNLPVVLYYGVFVTGLGYVFYLTAMQETSAIMTSSVFFIKPALAPFLALLVLGSGEAMGPLGYAGIALIVAAAFMMFFSKLKARDVV
jgi:drug/metabolite transporter (DMT)-like permease